MFWGKNRELVHDQRTRRRQSQCTDGLGLLIVVALEFGPQHKVCCFSRLLILQFRLPSVSDRSRTERRHLMRTHRIVSRIIDRSRSVSSRSASSCSVLSSSSIRMLAISLIG